MKNWCDSNCADLDDCCSSENRLLCFQSSSNSSAFANCIYIVDRINSCISATTGFATLSMTDQASCFCFDGNGTYDGCSWDNAATKCYAAMSTQTTWSASQLGRLFLSLCRSVHGLFRYINLKRSCNQQWRGVCHSWIHCECPIDRLNNGD